MNSIEAIVLMLKGETESDNSTVQEGIDSISKSDVVFDDFSEKEIKTTITMHDGTIYTLTDSLTLRDYLGNKKHIVGVNDKGFIRLYNFLVG